MKRSLLVAHAAIVALAAAALAFGPHSAPFDLDWRTIDGGGGASSVGSLTLVGTVGQHDAETVSTGGQFALAGGFWADASQAAPCPADINGDSLVNVDDLFAVLSAWGPCPGCPEDITGDGNVNVDDLFEVLNGWGPCP
jgi:hypothetical protein